MRQQYHLSKPLYAKRAAALKRIPHFWSLVFEQAPPDIDQFIQPEDSRIFAESLLDLSVSRPELDADLDKGNPKSFVLRFEFAPNDDFEDTVLEKSVWWRRASDGWAGYVSEPVRIHWKEDKDLSLGLTDAACNLFESRKKKGVSPGEDVPEHKVLHELVQSWSTLNTSFFSWFGWTSSRRYVDAEESARATAEHAARREKRNAAGQASSSPPSAAMVEAEREMEKRMTDTSVEVQYGGDDVAVTIAEELWPNAIKFFTAAQEQSDEASESDFEAMDDEVEGENEVVDMRKIVGENEVVDMRTIVDENGGGGDDDQRPKKKAKR